MSKITTLHAQLSTISTPFTLLGSDFGNRMTIITLSDQRLWIHSPVRLDEEAIAFINSLGDVAYVVAPNLFHHLHLSAFLQYFPLPHIYGPTGLDKKLKSNLKIVDLNNTENTKDWEADITCIPLEGMPKVNETLFFHHPSKSLIVTDLVFHFSQATGWSKFFFNMMGVGNRLATSRYFKSLIKDKAAFKASIDRVLNLDFDRIILSHGDIVESQAKERFSQSFDWLY